MACIVKQRNANVCTCYLDVVTEGPGQQAKLTRVAVSLARAGYHGPRAVGKPPTLA